jgi:hypothetical protein
VVDGKFGSPKVTLELGTPRGERIRRVYAAAHLASGSPPQPDITYGIDISTDNGRSWRILVEGWRVSPVGQQPQDFWSQSFCWGDAEVPDETSKVQLRFHNDGGRSILRAEAHLRYDVKSNDDTKVTFAWSEAGKNKTATHRFAAGKPSTWHVETSADPRTNWVEYEPVRNDES